MRAKSGVSENNHLAGPLRGRGQSGFGEGADPGLVGRTAIGLNARVFQRRVNSEGW